MKTIMRYKGFVAQIMEAQRLTGDIVHGLPPGTPRPVYFVDEFVDAPPNWVGGPGSFVVPVSRNKGLWFDWTKNDSYNTAVLPTVKGANPITGVQTVGFHLERYENKCPKHNVPFQADLYCPECDYKWPPQNYVTSPNTLWWDGFRNADGEVRQFFFTEDMMRDAASGLIGKDKTVPAFGFAFYSPKERRKQPETNFLRGAHSGFAVLDSFQQPLEDFKIGGNGTGDAMYMNHMYYTSNTSKGMSAGSHTADKAEHIVHPNSVSCFCSQVGAPDGGDLVVQNACSEEQELAIVPDSAQEVFEAKDVSVGAGAKINQGLVADPEPLDSWKSEPDAVMVVYFIFQDDFDKLKSRGMRDLSGKKEGMLSGIPVG